VKKLTKEDRIFYEEAFLSAAFAGDDTREIIKSYSKINERCFTDGRRRVIYRAFEVIDLNYESKVYTGDVWEVYETKTDKLKKDLEAAGALELAGGVSYVNYICHILPTDLTISYFARVLEKN
jgi:hypothetical protein